MFRSDELYAQELSILQQNGSLRQTLSIDKRLEFAGKKLINLASNDYLSLATLPFDSEDFNHFYSTLNLNPWQFASTGSPLLTGFTSFTQLFEQEIANLSGKAALAFNSGFEANSGVLEVIGANCLVLADKLSHASILDGISNAPKAKVLRFSHNNLEHLELLLKKYEKDFEKVLIISESIFSMDGDFAPLEALVKLKEQYPKVSLYIDEAHAFFTRPQNLLGLCFEQHLADKVDFILLTLGKAFAGHGAVLLCSKVAREYLVNKVRPYIFSTALPPIIWAFNFYRLKQDYNLACKRALDLQCLVKSAQELLKPLGFEVYSQIIPITVGSNENALTLSQCLLEKGYFALPIRHPTVPLGKDRVRISLNLSLNLDELTKLVSNIKSNMEINRCVLN